MYRIDVRTFENKTSFSEPVISESSLIMAREDQELLPVQQFLGDIARILLPVSPTREEPRTTGGIVDSSQRSDKRRPKIIKRAKHYPASASSPLIRSVSFASQPLQCHVTQGWAQSCEDVIVALRVENEKLQSSNATLRLTNQALNANLRNGQKEYSLLNTNLATQQPGSTKCIYSILATARNQSVNQSNKTKCS